MPKPSTIQWQTLSGEQITLGDTRITPQTQALVVRWPHGGFVWNRPTAVIVERGGKTERIPIVDVTRIVQLALLGLSILLPLMIGARLMHRRRARE